MSRHKGDDFMFRPDFRSKDIDVICMQPFLPKWGTLSTFQNSKGMTTYVCCSLYNYRSLKTGGGRGSSGSNFKGAQKSKFPP
ncbi:hypothetical protein H5410_040615 [Solanum commersonii]|uniref:Uncharacterized protein n=1 Tax=Solanum commersonii TaxID=4109 RepID=A0A9J5XQM1_SOLCO|nr:hypothetical protein H5410_040615 [Solanum commersonii]